MKYSLGSKPLSGKKKKVHTTRRCRIAVFQIETIVSGILILKLWFQLNYMYLHYNYTPKLHFHFSDTFFFHTFFRRAILETQSDKDVNKNHLKHT